MSCFNDFKEFRHRKFVVVGSTIIPDVPDKKRVYGFRKFAQITFYIKDNMVVKRYRYAHIVQGRSIALHVLNGVSVGMKHVRA